VAGIRVNSFSPGAVYTSHLRDAAARVADASELDELVVRSALAQPLGAARGGACLPSDVADVVPFLLSDKA
jgi:NAD(P)-dependent dehydrogenase (short-subunit alcohol dehydrogenase family)